MFCRDARGQTTGRRSRNKDRYLMFQEANVSSNMIGRPVCLESTRVAGKHTYVTGRVPQTDLSIQSIPGLTEDFGQFEPRIDQAG